MNTNTRGDPLPSYPPSVRTVRAVLAIQAAVWIMLGVLTASPTSPALPVSEAAWVIALLMFANATVFAVLAVAMRPARRGLFLFAVAVVLANLVLTVADQVGPSDAFALFLNVLTLGVLFLARSPLSAREG